MRRSLWAFLLLFVLCWVSAAWGAADLGVTASKLHEIITGSITQSKVTDLEGKSITVGKPEDKTAPDGTKTSVLKVHEATMTSRIDPETNMVTDVQIHFEMKIGDLKDPRDENKPFTYGLLTGILISAFSATEQERDDALKLYMTTLTKLEQAGATENGIALSAANFSFTASHKNKILRLNTAIAPRK